MSNFANGVKRTSTVCLSGGSSVPKYS